MSLFNSNTDPAGLPTERAVGERSRETGRAQETKPPNPELPAQRTRRSFTAAYKLRIIEQADACKGAGEIGALLRREGLYSSHLASWRKQRDAGALKALGRPRGRKGPGPLEIENRALAKRAQKAEEELTKARKVIEVQGKVSALLQEMLEAGSADQNPDGEQN